MKGLRKQTLLQTTSLLERRTTLLKRIQRFREIQRVSMPGFNWQDHTHAADKTPDDGKPRQPEDYRLFMPSELSVPDRRKYCPNGLADSEDRIRYAEASDALEDLRHHLRTRSFTNKFKIKNITGQIKNTRAREVQHRIDDKVRTAELRYRRAHSAVKTLRGPGEWEKILQVLDKSHVRALNERELNAQEVFEEGQLRARLGTTPGTISEERVIVQASAVGEGLRRPSWIWYTGVDAEAVDDPLTRKGK